MISLQVASSNALEPSFRRDLRTLLDTAFEGRFSDDDWGHALGGVHVWVTGPRGLISHASLVERVLVCDGHTLRAGYVEAVATVADQRRRGHGTTVMSRIGELIRERYDVGALATGTHAFYETLGWERWRGTTFAHGPHGRVHTPGDDGDVMILRTPRSPSLDLYGDIVCEWRPGEVW